MTDLVRVMVVDDSSSTRTMLREALSLDGGIEVVGEAGGGREAVVRAGDLRPDVVLMDVRMPDMDGVSATRSIISDMLTAGAIGYVVKGGTIDELSSAIRRAATGEPELDQRVLPAAVEDLRRLLEEERERREQVERLARAKAEFVQVLSHELRTPLTVIFGALRMLEQRGLGADEAGEVESALRRVTELEFLVEGLELVASGPVAEGVTEVDKAMEAAVQRIGAGPDVVAIEDGVWEGVPHRYVERVVFELLSNAVKHGVRPARGRGGHPGRFRRGRLEPARGRLPRLLSGGHVGHQDPHGLWAGAVRGLAALPGQRR
ncbi:MAG: response regulator [Actinobacteria bacterium]|nr:MAG: response regulator [Actinomycetota bacterium]